MSSETDDWSVLTPSGTDSKEFSMRPNLSTEKGLQRGSEPSCELGFQLDQPLQPPCDLVSGSCHENSLLSSQNVGKFGVEEYIAPLLHKYKKPHGPPPSSKVDFRLLRGVALENANDLDAAVEDVLNEVLPFLTNRPGRPAKVQSPTGGPAEVKPVRIEFIHQQVEKKVEVGPFPAVGYIDFEDTNNNDHTELTSASLHEVSTIVDDTNSSQTSPAARSTDVDNAKNTDHTEFTSAAFHDVSTLVDDTNLSQNVLDSSDVNQVTEHQEQECVNSGSRELETVGIADIGLQQSSSGMGTSSVYEIEGVHVGSINEPYEWKDFNDLKLNVVSCSKGKSRNMPTKGTTIVFILVRYTFIAVVDSRENFEGKGVKYVYSDVRKKYRVFWESVFVVFLGHVLIGEAVLQHLDKTFPPASQQATVEEVAKAVYQFYPTFNGECDVYIGGLLSDGSPTLQVVKFHHKDWAEPNVKQGLNVAKGIRFAVGAGAKEANSTLKSFNSNNVPLMKKGAGSSLLSACLTNPDTGGYINLIHMQMDEKGIVNCDISQDKVVKCMSLYFDSWMHKHYLIVFHDRRKQDAKYFMDWMRAKGRARVGLLSPIAKLKKKKLVMSCLEFQDKDVIKKMFDFGKGNTELLGDIGLREFEHKNIKFYLVYPSIIFLEDMCSKNQLERLAEYEEIPDTFKADTGVALKKLKAVGGVAVAKNDKDFLRDSDDDMVNKV